MDPVAEGICQVGKPASGTAAYFFGGAGGARGAGAMALSSGAVLGPPGCPEATEMGAMMEFAVSTRVCPATAPAPFPKSCCTVAGAGADTTAAAAAVAATDGIFVSPEDGATVGALDVAPTASVPVACTVLATVVAEEPVGGTPAVSSCDPAVGAAARTSVVAAVDPGTEPVASTSAVSTVGSATCSSPRPAFGAPRSAFGAGAADTVAVSTTFPGAGVEGRGVVDGATVAEGVVAGVPVARLCRSTCRASASLVAAVAVAWVAVAGMTVGRITVGSLADDAAAEGVGPKAKSMAPVDSPAQTATTGSGVSADRAPNLEPSSGGGRALPVTVTGPGREAGERALADGGEATTTWGPVDERFEVMKVWTQMAGSTHWLTVVLIYVKYS